MNFVAIDFELANAAWNSACSLGLCEVENGVVIRSHYWLIRPEPLIVGHIQQGIHGLTEEMLEEAPTFAEIWEKVLPLLEGRHVVAHNGAFDFGVLRRSLERWEIDYPSLQEHCSLEMAKGFLEELPSHRLNDLCNYFNLQLDHHNAASDARACAEVVLRMAQISADFSLISRDSGPIRRHRRRLTDEEREERQLLAIEPDDIPARIRDDARRIFEGQSVVFTGDLSRMSRETAYAAMEFLGAAVKSSVSKKINMVVIGRQDPHVVGATGKSNKERQAEELSAAGFPIVLMYEEEFYETLLVGESDRSILRL
jgi:DNA polymerase-3 subunit epsilon